MSQTKLLITQNLPDRLIEKISGVSDQLVIHQYNPEEEMERVSEILDEIDVIYTYNFLPRIEDAPNLKWVQLSSAGVDHILSHPLYTDSEITFTTTSGIHAVQMAEYTLMQMLNLAHKMPLMVEDKTAHVWTEGRWKRYVPRELFGATLGLVGYGSIARQVARLAQTFGMQVLALKRDARQLDNEAYALPDVGDPQGTIPDRVYPPEALHSFLGICDYVVVTIPLNDATRHMLDAGAFKAMKNDAFLVNVARGGVIDEAALAEALSSGQIAGAALDVFETEPLPEDSPLWDLPNAIISPHVSGFTPHYDDRATDVFVENMKRYLADESLINMVRREHNY